MDEQTCRDKMLGMILLGIYGDALGASHEAAGLNGQTQDPSNAGGLKPLSGYPAQSPPSSPWWLWPGPGDLPGDTKGAPTDDSSYRLTILHKWICELAAGTDQPTEGGFFDFVDRERQADLPDPPSTWHQNRKAMLDQWAAMHAVAEQVKRAHAAGEEVNPQENREGFFVPGVPVVFGLFLFLELTAVYACCPPDQVRDRFDDFTCLDQGYGKEVTGLYGALMAQAICRDCSEDFAQWFLNRLGQMLPAPGQGTPDQQELRRAFDEAKSLGESSQNLSEKDFLDRVKQRIYDPAQQGDPTGFKKYDPKLFLQQMVATAAYAGGDKQKILRLLASGAGDADTLPSMMGSVMGLFCGATALRANPALRADLDAVEHTAESLFGIELDEHARCLCRLAHRVGCWDRCQTAETPPSEPSTSPEPSTPPPNEDEDQRCFIATAAFGSPHEREVRSLRHFRDAHLARSAAGRWFIAGYYRCSPPLARWLSDKPWARTCVRAVLVRGVTAAEWVTRRDAL